MNLCFVFFFFLVFFKKQFTTQRHGRKDFVFLSESSEQRVDSKASQPFVARCYRCY